MITLLATAPLGKFSKDFLTALIPSKFVILVYRDQITGLPGLPCLCVLG